MNVLTTSWRRSLAATAVMACFVPLGGSSGEVSAAGFFAEEKEDAEHREREAIERREREDGERAERREMEKREHREREGDEREHRERDEHAQRERGEGEHRERDEHARRERGEGEQRLARERAELLEVAESIEREIHELGDGQDEKAHALHRRLEEIHERIGHLNRELGQGDRPGGHDIFRELIELQGRATELEVARAILPEGERERAEDLTRELNQVKEQLARLERECPDLPPEVVGEMKHLRLDQLLHAAARLEEAGKPDLAHATAAEARKLAEEIDREPRRRHRREGAEGGPERQEEMRRVHMRVAVENLHAAGLHEMAEKLARELEGRPGGRPPEPGRGPDGRQGPPRPHVMGQPHPHEMGPPRPHVMGQPRPHEMGPRGPHEMGPAVEELRGQMHQMRQEMNELRSLLEKVLKDSRR